MALRPRWQSKCIIGASSGNRFRILVLRAMNSIPTSPNDEPASKSAVPSVMPAEKPARVSDLPSVDERIDYEQYERPQLRESIESLLSVAATLKVFGLCLLVTFPMIWGLIAVLFLGRGWLVFGGATAGGFVIAGVLSLLAAMLLVARKILAETVRMVDETFGIVATIVKDIGAARAQGVVGTTAAVFRGVNRHLVLPIVEGSVRARFGWFSSPILWLYRGVFLRTIDASTQAMLTAASQIQVPGSAYVAFATDTLHSGVSSTAVSVDWWLEALRPYVSVSTRAIRIAVLAPLTTLLAITALATGIAVGCAWWWL